MVETQGRQGPIILAKLRSEAAALVHGTDAFFTWVEMLFKFQMSLNV